jgi:4-aminobutyrate aminotransferase-like enzyme
VIDVEPDIIAKSMRIGLYNDYIVQGKGSIISNSVGKKYIDVLSGAAVAVLGYGSNEIAKEYYDSSMKMQHTCFPYSINPIPISLARKLVEITPGDFEKSVIFGLTGSDSIDGAIKCARKFSGKSGIISFNDSYHGSTGFAFHATDWNKLKCGLGAGVDFHHVRFPDISKSKEEKRRIVEDIKHIISSFEIAGFIIEPIQGDSGIRVIDGETLRWIREICTQKNIVMIVDEIQSGIGRTGMWWGFEHFRVIPDIIVCGKGLAGGYAPISAIIGKRDILESLDKAQHVFTFSGHPPSCAAALKVIEIIERDELIIKNKQKGDYFIEEIKKIDSKSIKTVRGIGLMIGVEVYYKDKPVGSLIGLKCREKGVYMGYFGKNNEVLRIEPPFIITRQEIDYVVKAIKESIKEIESNKVGLDEIEFAEKNCVGLGD